MNIAILTFQNSNNYGAMLQAFALQEFLLLNGHEVKIIDYRCTYLENREYLNKNNSIYNRFKKKSISLILHSQNREREGKFNKFRTECLSLTKPYRKDTMHLVAGEYDAIIVGSDQVWNFELTGGDTTYFLDFNTGRAKIISYAASIGNDDIDRSDLTRIASLLEKFHHISVREASVACMLNQYFNTNSIECVLDPTLLIDQLFWKTIADKPQTKKPYIFVYSLGELDKLSKIAIMKAKELGCEIVCLCFGLRGIDGAHNVRNIGPIEFVSYLANAEHVITNSYHGICISIAFEKQFTYILSSEHHRNSRIIDLAKSLGLDDRAFESCNSKSKRIIDYNAVNEKLLVMRAHSAQFLSQALSFDC